MRARVPLDVDMEDRLVYGLTPVHLAYVVLGGLGGLALWSSHWMAAPVRAVAAVAIIALSAVLAWGTWRRRSVDRWAVDILLYLLRTVRVRWNAGWLRRLGDESVGPDVVSTEEPGDRLEAA